MESRVVQDVAFFLFLSLVAVFRFLTVKPDLKDGSVIIIKDERVLSESLRFDRSQRIKVLNFKAYIPLYPEVNYGDILTIKGRVNLEKKTIEDAEIISLKKGESFFAIREKIIDFFQKSLPPPYSSLLVGIVLGSKESISPSFWEELKKTGTAHVVVASGMNVSLVASFLVLFLIPVVGRRKAILFSLFGIWFYAILAGFDAPIIRAALMGSLTFGAMALGRQADALRVFFLTFLAMLILNPYWIFDIGFILSFAATLSLVLFSRRIDQSLKFIPSFIRQDFSTTIAAQILVSPILYFTFGYFSIYSFLVNGIVLWTVPLITVFGMLISFISLLLPSFASILVFIVYPLTFWFVEVVRFFA